MSDDCCEYIDQGASKPAGKSLGDMSQRENKHVMRREYPEVSVKSCPGVPTEAVKGYRTVREFNKPKGLDFD